MTTHSADAPGTPAEGHDAHCRRLLEHAAEMIAQGEHLQASEKLWDAVAHRVEALAAVRSWPYRSHTDGRVIARHIANHVGDPQIGTLFKVALDAHQNFYDNGWEDDEFAAALGEVRTLIDLLAAAERELPPDLEPPTAKHYRRRHGLVGALEAVARYEWDDLVARTFVIAQVVRRRRGGVSVQIVGTRLRGHIPTSELVSVAGTAVDDIVQEGDLVPATIVRVDRSLDGKHAAGRIWLSVRRARTYAEEAGWGFDSTGRVVRVGGGWDEGALATPDKTSMSFQATEDGPEQNDPRSG